MKSAKRILAALAATLSLGAAPAQADLLINGGFETGNLTGWAPAGVFLPTVRDLTSLAGTAVHDGSYGVFLTPGDSVAGTNSNILQQVALPGPGDYEFGGWIRALAPGTASGDFDQVQLSLFIPVNGFSKALGGSVANFTGFAPLVGTGYVISDWQYFSYQFTYGGPAGGIAQINFNLQNQYDTTRASIGIGDSFFLRTANVPEPGSLALLALGSLGLFGAARRRRRD